MKNENGDADDSIATATQKPRPEQGADSQLHNYNVMLTSLRDLFGDDDDEAEPAKK